LKREYQTMKLR